MLPSPSYYICFSYIGQLSLRMPPANKKDNELKAHLEDNKLDLSLMQHDVITSSLIRQIAGLPKGIVGLILL